jgi:hypothetical protein
MRTATAKNKFSLLETETKWMNKGGINSRLHNSHYCTRSWRSNHTEKHTETHTHTHTRWQGCETRRAWESVRLKTQNRKRHELQSSARARSGGDLGYWKKGQWERGEIEREISCSCKEACSSSNSNKKQQSERASDGRRVMQQWHKRHNKHTQQQQQQSASSCYDWNLRQV